MAPPVSAQKPCIGRQPRDLRAHRVDDAPAAEQRAEPHRRLAGHHHPERHVELAAEMPLREQQHGDDAHGLLRVVAAMAERIERARDELQIAERPVDRAGVARTNSHETISTSSSARKKPISRRQHDAPQRSCSTPLHTIAPTPALADARADQAADQRVRRARRGDAGPPGDQVPGDRAHQRAEDHLRSATRRGSTMPRADRVGHVQAEEQEGDEVEERRPHHRVAAAASTRVETMVAIELAASCRPFRKSNTRATPISDDQRSRHEGAGPSGWPRQSVVDHDAADLVGDVLEAVDHLFQVVVDFAADDEGHRVAACDARHEQARRPAS